ncbi:MAG: isoleucine--tRNA ligase [Rickettsiales bacterium]|jgi:isoleucyl-tRNA synthetase|nr:isoleucine--tRNA ligase [Rickettsiales bacterium]
MYPKTDARANFPQMEQEILGFWRANDIFHKSLEKTKDGAPFTFFDGPPFANGTPHWGHVGVSAMKDMVFRFKTMGGRYVLRELGWDCHGLPAEQSVEKSQKKLAKDIVAGAGIGGFCEMCRADVLKYTDVFKNVYEREGRWVETGPEFGYATMDKNYMESVIWAIKQLHDKGLLYKDFSVNPFDWKLGTVLSNSEAAQEYMDVIDDAVTVWFELADGRRVLAWTTTPWTLPGNSALAVNPKMKYAVMRDTDSKEYIIAESRVSAYEKQLATTEKIGEVMGSELVGLQYKPLFDYYIKSQVTNHKSLYTVIPADYVSDSDGTGIVHIAPAFGQEDFWAAKNIDQHFPVILNVDNYGNFTDEVTDWAGENIFEATPKIIAHLKESGNLVKKDQHKHSYPFSYRTHEKLIYRAADSWYIDVPKIQERLIENTKKTDWKSAGERFMRWIENARPWAISRNRFWGTPLPIWERDGEYKVFGSVAEMEEFFETKIKDLHRPTLDALTRDGWTRIPDVLDCWVESGSMPFAQLHYPFENAERFNATFPADYIIEGPDQTRGWFYSLMVLATALFDKPAFKTVSVNGLILDDQKRKMSKSLGNYEDPMILLDKYGADAVRLYILGGNFMKCEPIMLDKAGTVFIEPTKNVLTPLWNAYHFFTLYANAGNITAKKVEKWFVAENVLDRYILTELNELFKSCNAALDDYKPDTAVRAISEFLEILNNWYIRRSRERFWNEDQNAFNTLWTVLIDLCRLIAPLAPFVTEYIYRAITGLESVHLQAYPHYNENKNSMDLLSDMRKIQEIISVGKQLRDKYGLRNRLPLEQIWIYGDSLKQLFINPEFANIIREELNIKSMGGNSDISSVADSFVYLITPKIGARLGSKLKDIIAASKQPGFNPDAWGLLPDEFETRLNMKSGVTGAALPDNTAVVVLDTNVTPELIREGLARDALRFIQDMRRTRELDVSDRIVLEYSADPELALAISAHADMIKENALVTELRENADTKEFETEIEDNKFGIKIAKA